MAIGEYLKAAATQLRQAAAASKSEGDELRRQITLREQEVTRSINSLKQHIRGRRQELRTLNVRSANDALKAAEITAVTSLEQEIKNIQQALEKERQAILQEIQVRENQINELNNKAGDFERQAGAV